MKAPLAGIRVLDLSRYISGPYCGMLLGDLGADVVKVEKANGGDDTRALPPFYRGESLYTFAMNRSKRGVALDFRSEAGQKTLFDLACKADILIENFKAGTIERMGLGYEKLKEHNPGLIMVSITGFGADGPYRDKPGFDAAVQAMSGLMSITGDPEGMPMMYGTYAVDFSTALHAATAALAALYSRDKTGKGQRIQLSLLECAATMLLTGIPDYCATGHVTGRVGNRDRYTAPGNCFRTKDGRILMIIAGNQPHFERLARAMGREDLLSDERFARQEIRFTHAVEIEAEVAKWVAQHDMDEVKAILDAASIVSAKVEDVRDVAENPQLLYRNKLIKVQDPVMGEMTMMGAPFDFSESELDLSRPSPKLGQHNEEVLRDWLGAGEHGKE